MNETKRTYVIDGGEIIEENVMHQLALLSGYEEPVPYIIDFINDPYYLGKILVDGDGECSVYPIWIDALKQLYPTPYITSAIEVYLTGGIGLGKTTASKIITLYDICKLLCLKNPQEYFKLLPTTQLRFMLMNVTKGLAESVIYNETIEWVLNSPFFKSKLSPVIKGRRKSASLFQKNIDIGVGSRGKDALGQATFGALMSEINDMTVVSGQADDNFDTIYTRMQSRFGGKGVPMIGHIIMDSSNKGNKSFIDTRIEEKNNKGIKDYKLFRFSHWQAKWHLGGYSGKMFKVYAGDQYRDPFIFDPNKPIEVAGLDPVRIIDAPVEHYQEFHFNIIKSLKDLAGVSTFGTWSFISSAETLRNAAKHVNPVTVSTIELDFFNEDTLNNYIDVSTLAFLCNKPRFIHIDLGIKNDATGIGCSYQDGFMDTVKYDPVSKKTIRTRAPKYVCEFVIRVKSRPGQEVSISKIKNFIINSKQMGLPIQRVSTDGYQSTQLRQDLTLAGIECALISLDRTKDGYNYVRNAILEERLDLPNDELLIKEFFELEEGEQKFDHPDNGSKDLADGASGSIYNCWLYTQEHGSLISADEIAQGLQQMMTNTDTFKGNSSTTNKKFQDFISNKMFKR